jgi:predicted hotdog family 3-hydroxylacyl-ACP dehydratase
MEPPSLPIGPEGIAALIPHSGTMRLLDRIDAVSETELSCTALSHLSPENPLRSGAHLPVSAGIEYAAQAMAAHGALTRRDSAPRRGFLVIASGVAWNADRLDVPETELAVRIVRLAVNGGAAQYSFTLTAGPSVEVTGTLMLQLEQAEA